MTQTEHRFRTTSRTTLVRGAILAFGIAGAALVATGRGATAVVQPNGGLPGRRRLRDSGGRRDCGTGDRRRPRAGFRRRLVQMRCIQACSAVRRHADRRCRQRSRQGAAARGSHPRLEPARDCSVCELHPDASPEPRAHRCRPGRVSSAARPRRVRGIAGRAGEDAARTRTVRAGRCGRTGPGTENKDESARLSAALQAAHAPALPPSAGDLRAVVSHHTWLQEQATTGAWQDLASTPPHAKPGTSLCAADATTANLPATAYDTVTARVRVERRASGKLDDQTPLEHTWRAADLARSSLTFAFAEAADVKVSATPVPAGLRRSRPPSRWTRRRSPARR